MARLLPLVFLLGGLLTGCSKSKPTQSLPAPVIPPLPRELSSPPSPDKLAKQGRLPAGLPALPRDFQMPPAPDLSNLPPPPKDLPPPPLPPGVQWPPGLVPPQ